MTKTLLTSQFPAGPPQGELTPSGGSDPRQRQSVGVQFPAGPPQGELTPSGGSDPRQRQSVGVQFPAGPPQGELAPSGGSDPRQRQSVGALIFDMDGTMIDSMPSHKHSWLEFARRKGLEVDIDDLMRRTTGRTGLECMRILFNQVDMDEAQAMAHVHEKETVYRELFQPIFAEVAGFKSFYELARGRGLKLGVGTAGDRHNQAFAYTHLKMPVPPLTTVGGDEGLAGKPDPAIFLEAARRMGVAPAHCIVFEDAPLGIEAARRAGMRAVGIASSHHPDELTGPHVLAVVRDYHALIASQFLENTHVATS